MVCFRQSGQILCEFGSMDLAAKSKSLISIFGYFGWIQRKFCVRKTSENALRIGLQTYYGPQPAFSQQISLKMWGCRSKQVPLNIHKCRNTIINEYGSKEIFYGDVVPQYITLSVKTWWRNLLFRTWICPLDISLSSFNIKYEEAAAITILCTANEDPSYKALSNNVNTFKMEEISLWEKENYIQEPYISLCTHLTWIHG